MTKLEQIAKAQAKTLVKTLELLELEGLEDSDMRELKRELNAWIWHITPLKVAN
jgi:hypothetical protein